MFIFSAYFRNAESFRERGHGSERRSLTEVSPGKKKKKKRGEKKGAKPGRIEEMGAESGSSIYYAVIEFSDGACNAVWHILWSFNN